eukprot:m.182407 g.182407  ORF g.182407 m.182407 type:complete len:62 (-) comp18461_c0_seq2:1325-1510(-)
MSAIDYFRSCQQPPYLLQHIDNCTLWNTRMFSHAALRFVLSLAALATLHFHDVYFRKMRDV